MSQTASMDPAEDAWLLHPLPANATTDPQLNAKLLALVAKLPNRWYELFRELENAKLYSFYETAVNSIAPELWRRGQAFLESPDNKTFWSYTHLFQSHMVPEALARVCRRLVKHPSSRIRNEIKRILRVSHLREVALPAKKGGAWNTEGWLVGVNEVDIARHKTGEKVLEENNLPVLKTVAEVRKLLQIRSPEQLGFFLLASDHNGGPYTTFTIKKSSGANRLICAPKPQLKWVQRRILSEILEKIPSHDAAHGFVIGRSTVTNATPHLGAKLLVKFDLKDFFPTLHFYRVLGLFAHLGYPLGNAKFSTDDESTSVSPVLARLCCYTSDPKTWGTAFAPQGAPTSPALSNIVCRRLDSRLSGLAKKLGGVYTRYADDLTFSFRESEVHVGRFRWWVDQICHQEGFFINHDKFRVIRGSQRQVVTGLVVNDTLNVPREERRRLRAIIHNCQKNGVEKEARGNAGFTAYLRGFASYLNMVDPNQGPEILKQVNALLGHETEDEA